MLFYNRKSPSRTPEKRLDCHRITLCTIAAQAPPARFAVIVALISIVAGKSHKKPHHPSKVQPMNGFYGHSLRQVASASLHYTPGLHFVPPPFVTFRSLSASSLGNPRKSVSIHSISLMPTRRFFPLPFGFPAHVPELKAKTGSSIPPLPIRYIAFSHHPCFPHANQRYALRSVHP